MPSLEELTKEYGNVTLVAKRIGKQHYQYGVVWDRKKKKQIWKYIGKITNAEKEKTRPLFTEREIETIREAYQWCLDRKKKKQGAPPLDALGLVLRRLDKCHW